MLGASSMVNNDQIIDCLERGWIVVVPDHRLCPQVDILEGPIQDIRDLSSWIHSGKLDDELSHYGSELCCDLEKVIAFGTSAGGHLAMSLVSRNVGNYKSNSDELQGFDHAYPPAAILDFYGPSNFADSFWTEKLPTAAKLPPFESNFISQVYDEEPVATRGGISLEGQQPQSGPDFSNPRVAFAMTHIANGKVWDVCYSSKNFKKVDPALNVSSDTPPICIVHGDADTMVPLRLSKMLYQKLKNAGVDCEMIEVPGEEHTFAGKMVKGSQTWELQRKGFEWVKHRLQKL
jgi:acetyl esterase/lipase